MSGNVTMEFHWACRTGDLEKVTNFLSQKMPDESTINFYGSTGTRKQVHIVCGAHVSIIGFIKGISNFFKNTQWKYFIGYFVCNVLNHLIVTTHFVFQETGRTNKQRCLTRL